MRSRYSAYTLNNLVYLARNLAPESREREEQEAEQISSTSLKWSGLEIRITSEGCEEHETGIVEFVAKN